MDSFGRVDIVATVSLEADARTELDELVRVHRLRAPRIVDGRPGPAVVLDGAEVVNLASNDYLSLSGDARLVRAAQASLEADGVGAGASRLITGTHRQHVALEAALGDWLGRPARLFNTGYAANVGVLTALADARDVIFSDELNHASLIDGCRLSRARVVVIPHADGGALEAALRAHPAARRRLVVTESLFSMDGDIVDVAAIHAICARHDAALILDEAHAIGARGTEGRGVAADAGVVPDVVIGTFGKALGSFGAFAASGPAITELLYNRARMFVFSTALPPSTAAASTAAIAIVRGRDGDDRRRALAANARQLREAIPTLGGARDGAIAPLHVGNDMAVMALSERLLARGVFAQGIRPPTVPDGTARLRISVSSGHEPAQLQRALATLRELVP